MIKDLRAGDPASVGPYRLLGRLGAGGMGEVYLAKSPGGRLVAIKLIRPELAEERGFRSRFASEITAARNVSGIYTAAVVDADAEAELPWMATVYVAGPSLTDAVEDNGPLPVKSVLALAAGLAEALQAIHRAGLVHRDLKPSNVLLATDGPRVIDFGISLALERSMMTATGMVMGSPGFMSPEQARGQREIGAPTDMFSFGAVLAFAATGDNPFGRGPTPALLYRVVNEPPDLATVPARLRPLIEQCLAKDPADRPTPADVLASLSDDVEVLTGEWLPQSIAETMVRYSPTLLTPLPPALREAGEPQAEPGPAPAESVPAASAALGAAALGAAALGAAAAGPPSPEPATPGPASPDSGTSGPVGYEPTVLGPVILPPPAPAPVSATRVEHSLLPDTSLVAMPGALMAAGRDIPGATGGMPPAGPPPPPLRRWRWPIAAAAVAVIVAVVAVLLAGHSPGATSKVSTTPTASLTGKATKPPATPTTTATPSQTPTTPTSQPAVSTPSTQASATVSSTAPASATSTPTPTTSQTAPPTSTSSASSAATATTSSQTPAETTTTAPAGAATSNPTAAASGTPTS